MHSPKVFDELQEAAIRAQFRHMYHDLGFRESCKVLAEILVTGSILAEIIDEEIKNDKI